LKVLRLPVTSLHDPLGETGSDFADYGGNNRVCPVDGLQKARLCRLPVPLPQHRL